MNLRRRMWKIFNEKIEIVCFARDNSVFTPQQNRRQEEYVPCTLHVPTATGLANH